MYNIERDGRKNKRLPGDYKKALADRIWICSNCGKEIPSSSNNIFYVRSLDFVYHRDSDGCLYPCREKGGVRHVGEYYWGKPLKIKDEIFTIKEPVENLDKK